MKKLIISILAVICITLSSCNDTPTNIEPQKQNSETTVELQKLAATDTNTYKVVELNKTVYVMQKELVVKKVTNQSGSINTLTLMCLIVFILGILIGIGIVIAYN